MHTPSILAGATILVLQGIVVLLWAMPCGMLAMKGEKDGIGFWKTFLVSFFMTPVAGMVMVFAARSTRPSGSISENAGPGSAAASLRTS